MIALQLNFSGVTQIRSLKCEQGDSSERPLVPHNVRQAIHSVQLSGQDRARGRLVGSSAWNRLTRTPVHGTDRQLRDLLGTLDLAAIMVREINGAIRFWSRGCEQLFGWTAPEAHGKDAHALLATEFLTPRAHIETALLRDGEWSGDLVRHRRNGTEVVVAVRMVLQRDAHGHPIAVLENLSDVTALRQAEADRHRLNLELENRLRREVAAREAAQVRAAQGERMQALGQLAGGIAHDFNNVLQGISAGAALIEQGASDPEAANGYARMILDAADRGAAITRRLLAFARRDSMEPTLVDSQQLLDGLCEILTHTLGASIAVQVDAPPDLPTLFTDKAQLETVLVNFAANARDAMPGGGTLTLTAREEHAGADHITLPAPGAYVRLSVADTGIGMDSAVLARAPEPFFTTKTSGQGTGLGLAMAKDFAERSGGALAIDSAPGRGTMVTLWIPCAKLEPVEAWQPEAPNSGYGAKVLLVDDEPLVCETLSAQLQRRGYAVLAYRSAEAALTALEQGVLPELLVTDLTMPGMDGLALIRRVRARHADLPAILLTGSPTEVARLDLRDGPSGQVTLLHKPASGEQIARAMAELLSEAGAVR